MSSRLLLILLIALVCATACNLNAERSITATANAAPTRITAATQPAASTATPRPTATATVRPTTVPSVPVVLPPTIVNCTVQPTAFTYVIVGGDTLFSIATRAGTNVNALAQANCIRDPQRIEAGQTLYLPRAIVTPVPPPATNPAQYFLIAPDDNGASGTPVGCADSIIPVSSGSARTGVITTDIRASLEALFGIKTEFFGQSGLASALYNSTLTVQNVTVSGDQLIVDLSGGLQMVGTCSDARMQAQLLYTIFQYPGFNTARITIGGTNMKQLFDMSGDAPADAVYQRSDVGL